MKVLFVGNTPSILNNDPDAPFVEAGRYPKLVDWISYLEPTEFTFRNSHTPEEINNIKACKFAGWKIVALGLTVSRRLDKNDIDHFTMDHPGGNVKTNNKNYLDKRLQMLYDWIRCE